MTTTITALPAASALDGTEVLAADQASATAKVTATNLGLAVGPLNVAPWNVGSRGYGLPGRRVSWGTAGTTLPIGWVAAIPFHVGAENATFDAYSFVVDVGGAGALVNIAIYSCPDFKSTTVATKVAGSEVTGQSAATSGSKTATLAAPLTLTQGFYCLAFLQHTGVAATYWALTQDAGYQGAAAIGGTNETISSTIWAAGQSSLAATYVQTNAASNSGIYATLRRS